MAYEFFKKTFFETDLVKHKIITGLRGLYRIEHLKAERYMGSGNWKVDESGDVAGAIKLGMSGWANFDQVTEEEAEKLKLQLFPETG